MTATAAAIGLCTTVLGSAVAVHDLRHRRIPNRLVSATALAALVLALWRHLAGDPVWRSVIAGALLAGGCLLGLHLASPRGMGFGDVKFAAALGALLGAAHWALAAVMLLLASLAGASASLFVRSWRRSLPFGLWLGAGALAAALAGRFFIASLGLHLPAALR